jgi:NAD(P)-dependent dehydrogenase (short-subunit alcohol dehydrogenase family)
VNGRVAIVTGGTGALGRIVVRRLAAAGATVWVPYRSPGGLDELRALLGADAARLAAEPADVTDGGAFGRLVSRALDRHRRIDVLVNAAGGFAGGDLLSTPLDEWRRVMELNLSSAVVGCRAVLPAMRDARAGRIVNVGSLAVVTPAGGFIAYAVSKSAVITLTQALATEVRGLGIAVNAVLPGTMDTAANRRAMPDADRARWVSPDRVAAVIAFLCSDEAAAITGAAIPVG